MSPRLLVSLVLALTLVWSVPVRADNIEISHISLEGNDEGYALDADFQIDLNPRLEDAINKGVALYFVVEFELTRSRWYWFDEHPASRQLVLRLSYHALTRQYRISSGAPVSKLLHPARGAAGTVAGAFVAGAGAHRSWTPAPNTRRRCACAWT